MKKDAVQNERDRISSRKPTQEEMQIGANTGRSKQKLCVYNYMFSYDYILNVNTALYRSFYILGMSVPVLLNAEVSSRQNGSHGYYCITEQLTDQDIANKQLATIQDIADSMKQQLLILVEWAKFIPVFSELTLDDQVLFLSKRVILLTLKLNVK